MLRNTCIANRKPGNCTTYTLQTLCSSHKLKTLLSIPDLLKSEVHPKSSTPPSCCILCMLRAALCLPSIAALISRTQGFLPLNHPKSLIALTLSLPDEERPNKMSEFRHHHHQKAACNPFFAPIHRAASLISISCQRDGVITQLFLPCTVSKLHGVQIKLCTMTEDESKAKPS